VQYLGVLTLAYFLCYTAFAALTRSLADPLSLLPTSVAAGSAVWLAYLLASGDWRRHRLDGPAVTAGLAGAAILTASTVAYSLRGASILLPLLAMKGGVLLMAPILDRLGGGRPRSLAPLALAACGVAVVAVPKLRADGTWPALACAAVYLAGYALKLRAIGQRRGDWGFFLAETSVTLAVALPAALVACYASGRAPTDEPAALLAGAASQGCGVFGGLILLQRGTHSVLVPLNRCSSTLAGVAATLLLGGALTPWETAGAACMLAALLSGLRPVPTRAAALACALAVAAPTTAHAECGNIMCTTCYPRSILDRARSPQEAR
jgi:hypothetical protein